MVLSFGASDKQAGEAEYDSVVGLGVHGAHSGISWREVKDGSYSENSRGSAGVWLKGPPQGLEGVGQMGSKAEHPGHWGQAAQGLAQVAWEPHTSGVACTGH